MIKILANDGLHRDALAFLEEKGYFVDMQRVDQDDLADRLPGYAAIIVRSATKITKELIATCPDLKLIVRAGVGLDNIDVSYATAQGVKVLNTPAASAHSVAELAFAHMMTLSRNLHLSNREMPSLGYDNFKTLKKAYSSGRELYGKKLGVIGLGSIGRRVASIGYGLGMHVLPLEYYKLDNSVHFALYADRDEKIQVDAPTVTMEKLLTESDYISLHIPYKGEVVIGDKEIAMMKDSVILVNAARGGVLDEAAALRGLDSGKISGLGLDVYENEPTPNPAILQHPKVSITPHIGASTLEANRNVGIEVAQKIAAFFKKDEN